MEGAAYTAVGHVAFVLKFAILEQNLGAVVNPTLETLLVLLTVAVIQMVVVAFGVDKGLAAALAEFWAKALLFFPAFFWVDGASAGTAVAF